MIGTHAQEGWPAFRICSAPFTIGTGYLVYHTVSVHVALQGRLCIRHPRRRCGPIASLSDHVRH